MSDTVQYLEHGLQEVLEGIGSRSGCRKIPHEKVEHDNQMRKQFFHVPTVSKIEGYSHSVMLNLVV